MPESSIFITQGSQTPVAVDSIGGTAYQTVKLDMGTIGASNPFSGTLPTINSLGTLNSGTINAGTVRTDSRNTQNALSCGTTFVGTAAAYGTLVGSSLVGIGTSIWVNLISIDNPFGTIPCMVSFGTALQGSSVLWRGVLGTQGAVGVVAPFPKSTNAGMTNQDLVCYIGGAGTVDFTVNYFISTQ